MCQSEFAKVLAELTEFAAELSEISLPKQFSRNSIPLPFPILDSRLEISSRIEDGSYPQLFLSDLSLRTDARASGDLEISAAMAPRPGWPDSPALSAPNCAI